MRRALPAIGLTILAVAGLAAILLSIAEKRVIGTWEYNGLDATRRIKFTSDHRVTDWWPDMGETEETGVHGTWRITGLDVALNMDYKSVFKNSAITPPPAEGKMPLGDFRPDAHKTQDRPYFVRVHD
jgi:hypothetical protein